ncbi:hypothetical protein B0T14DRAFT_212612 [Immersiella caudata]|uniref:Uncharacterized protein n=1 Tax=Immersiella caudata TaxID=314043 RepID=A0AA39WQJ6_9PEZI|nr:hypothetical protein B0T14DRAFT_212612 [Immersiella caudata]
MSASRALGLQLSRATCRPALSRWAGARPVVSRRGYASAHGKPSSDMPWLVTSVVVSVPIGFYLWKQGPGRPKSSHSAHGGHETHGAKHDEVSHKGHDGEEGSKSGEAKNEGGDGKGKDEKSDDSSKSPSKEMDDSQENQATKLTDKPASKRVDPTEK